MSQCAEQRVFGGHALTMSSADAPIAGIVLAAGESRRMGTNKLLLTLAGEPLVWRVCRRALAARLNPLIVVLGHQYESVRNALVGLDCRFAFNAHAGGSMISSLHRGLDCLPPSTDAVVVMLADMVHVTECMVRALTAAATASSALLVASRYEDILAPPTLFRRALFPELLTATDEGCGKAVVERHRAGALVLDWPLAALADIDTPEEFAKL